MASRKPETRSVVVAHASVDGTVGMELRAPETLRVAAGQPIHLKLTYRLREASRDEEEYRFELVSRFGEERDAPAVAHWGDTWGYPEDISGFVLNRYTPRRPGTFDLVWQAIAEYTVHGWGEEVRDGDLSRSALKGRIQVVVEG